MRVIIESANPSAYSAEIWLDDEHVGGAQFNGPAVQACEFAIRPDNVGQRQLSFRVPYLWKPAERIEGSNDERLLGISVQSVTIE